ncbi:hypothetical protein CROQUDRAFT_666681 [Cronartium quercuum f. sp. fusiforme G11]|uniref:Myb-like domain-containing protein n=1 Tax=Cronartium quercuum f. sp. fusiforme G11 TaxID=708437 RepID=A0A9P6N553_9BASI|nr:hypothetical protein CROQUDRAFT_666681 [Cronartium quercuum f. sp. fusiforme G11]
MTPSEHPLLPTTTTTKTTTNTATHTPTLQNSTEPFVIPEPEPDLLLAFAHSTSHSSPHHQPIQFPTTSSPLDSDPNLDPFLASLQHLPPTTIPIPLSDPSPTSAAYPHSNHNSNQSDHPFDQNTIDDNQLHSLLFSTSPTSHTRDTNDLLGSVSTSAFDPSILAPLPSLAPHPPPIDLQNLVPLQAGPSKSSDHVSLDTVPSTSATVAVAPTPKPSKLPKAKLTQCLQLREAAEKALEAVWDTLGRDRLALSAPVESPSTVDDLKISRGLDRQFGELHALSAPFKPEDLALIWPQCISNKALKANYNSSPSAAYFGIRKANIAFVAEYILYAMPGEEAYGKNDIVYACEGFLPLVLDKGLVQDEESWKLFNELKVQIYIQRLDQSGKEEANTRVLPNLFVETLSSYSGVQIAPKVEAAFEARAAETKAELVAADADLDQLRLRHPYTPFAISALRLLRKCQEILEAEQAEWQSALELDAIQASFLTQPGHDGQGGGTATTTSKRKRKRKLTIKGSNPLSPLFEREEARQMYDMLGDQQKIHGDNGGDLDQAYFDADRHHHVLHHDDISVGQEHHHKDDEYDQDGENNHKGRYNPYRLGRGKGPAAAPRRRWTQEEHELLLEEVRLHSNKYDCMAQIIKRHGKNGELSDILKDQNNVSLKDKARNLTMEWSRHGYPEDKPWLKEAFARFAVKPRASGQAHHGRRGGSEEEVDQPQHQFILDPSVLLDDLPVVRPTHEEDEEARLRLDLVELMGGRMEEEEQQRLQLDPELLGGGSDGGRNESDVLVQLTVEGDVPVDPSLGQ